MEPKDQWQVCSLELSKRLKELGYPQEGLWWWHTGLNQKGWHVSQKERGMPWVVKNYEHYSAPTIAELLKFRFNQFGSFNIFVGHYNEFADRLAEGIIEDLENKEKRENDLIGGE